MHAWVITLPDKKLDVGLFVGKTLQILRTNFILTIVLIIFCCVFVHEVFS